MLLRASAMLFAAAARKLFSLFTRRDTLRFCEPFVREPSFAYLLYPVFVSMDFALSTFALSAKLMFVIPESSENAGLNRSGAAVA